MITLSILVRTCPSTKVTVPGIGSSSSVDPEFCSRLNEAISETRTAFGGSIEVGWSNKPPRVDWYMFLAISPNSFAMSVDEVLPPIRRTVFVLKF
jgi:hypothetical protein